MTFFPEMPYAGTSGWSGSSTSQERAVSADEDGTTSVRQRQTLSDVSACGSQGITWRELASRHGWHHGTASGVLSVLHKTGHLARLTERRDRCQIYVLPEHVQGRTTAPFRPNSASRELTERETRILLRMEEAVRGLPERTLVPVPAALLAEMTATIRRLSA